MLDETLNTPNAPAPVPEADLDSMSLRPVDRAMAEQAPHESKLARAGVTVIVFGAVLHIIGLFPQLINLDITPGIGVMQVFLMLMGIGIWGIGGFIYAYATRHRQRPTYLREDIGIRLAATGYVVCITAGLADILGIGSHNADVLRPFFGPWQTVGLTIGMGTMVFGLLLYAGRYNPTDGSSTGIRLDREEIVPEFQD